MKHYRTESLHPPGYPATASVLGDEKRDTCITHSLEQIKTKIRQSNINTPLWTTDKIQRIISQKSLNYCDNPHKVLLTPAQCLPHCNNTSRDRIPWHTYRCLTVIQSNLCYRVQGSPIIPEAVYCRSLTMNVRWMNSKEHFSAMKTVSNQRVPCNNMW
jgi:hypothetical protein